MQFSETHISCLFQAFHLIKSAKSITWSITSSSRPESSFNTFERYSTISARFWRYSSSNWIGDWCNFFFTLKCAHPLKVKPNLIGANLSRLIGWIILCIVQSIEWNVNIFVYLLKIWIILLHQFPLNTSKLFYFLL